MALGDAILACLTERPMTGYELAKTFDSSIGFFWKADHQQIYRELSKLRDRGYIQGREVVQSGKPNSSSIRSLRKDEQRCGTGPRGRAPRPRSRTTSWCGCMRSTASTSSPSAPI